MDSRSVLFVVLAVGVLFFLTIEAVRRLHCVSPRLNFILININCIGGVVWYLVGFSLVAVLAKYEGRW